MIKELLDDIDKLYDENCMLQIGNNGQKFFKEFDAIRVEVRKLKHGNEMNGIQLIGGNEIQDGYGIVVKNMAQFVCVLCDGIK